MRGIVQGIGRIGVHHQANARPALAQRGDGLNIPSGLNFNFDALIAGGQFLLDFGEQRFDIGLNAD